MSKKILSIECGIGRGDSTGWWRFGAALRHKAAATLIDLGKNRFWGLYACRWDPTAYGRDEPAVCGRSSIDLKNRRRQIQSLSPENGLGNYWGHDVFLPFTIARLPVNEWGILPIAITIESFSIFRHDRHFPQPSSLLLTNDDSADRCSSIRQLLFSA